MRKESPKGEQGRGEKNHCFPLAIAPLVKVGHSLNAKESSSARQPIVSASQIDRVEVVCNRFVQPPFFLPPPPPLRARHSSVFPEPCCSGRVRWDCVRFINNRCMAGSALKLEEI